jgi:hypothetical protein
MFKERRSSFRKNIVFLVCITFVLMVFPQVTQAATRSSSKRFSLHKESTPLISAVFSFASLNSSLFGCDLALFYCLSKNAPIPPEQLKKGKGGKDGNKNNGPPVNIGGNSTSKKKPKSKEKS